MFSACLYIYTIVITIYIYIYILEDINNSIIKDLLMLLRSLIHIVHLVKKIVLKMFVHLVSVHIFLLAKAANFLCL